LEIEVHNAITKTLSMKSALDQMKVAIAGNGFGGFLATRLNIRLVKIHYHKPVVLVQLSCPIFFPLYYDVVSKKTFDIASQVIYISRDDFMRYVECSS